MIFVLKTRNFVFKMMNFAGTDQMVEFEATQVTAKFILLNTKFLFFCP